MREDAGFWLPVLGETALRGRFPATVLERGRHLAVGPCESRLQGASRQVAALVQGSRIYRTQLLLAPGTALRGDCECRHALGGSACKHQAALALAWRRQLVGSPAPAPDGEAAARLAVAALFEATPARAQDLSALIPSLQTWRAEDPAWALAAAEQALPPLCRHLERLQAERGWAEGETEWRALTEAVVAELFAAWAALGPRPAAYAERYLALLDADRQGLIDPRPALALLGPALADRASQLLRQRWEAGGTAHDYLQHLAACNDSAERLRVLAEARSDAASHAAYVQALLETGQARMALSAAEMAQRSFPQDRALQALLLARYEADGWDEEAQTLRRLALLREPRREAYRELLAAGDAQTERQQLWTALQQAPARAELGSLRLWLCIDESRFDEGLDWLQAQPGFAAPALQDFALALPEARAEDALALLKRALEQGLRQARPPFKEELALLRLVLERLSPEAGRLYTTWLRLEHRHRTALASALKGLGECRP